MKVNTAHVLIARTCVNNCIFCAVAGKRKAQAFPTKSEVLGFIQNIAAGGGRHLVFSGLGEPTLDPNFEEYLGLTKDLGFKRICLFTNGHGLNLEKAKRWKDNGLTEVLLSLHGIEKDHDRNVQRVGSFQEAISAFQLYTALGLSVTINTCLTKLNLAQIPQLRKLLAKYPVKMHTLSFPQWSGNAEVFKEHMLDYEEISVLADRLIPAEDTITFFDNIPYCVVQKKTREMQGIASVRLLDGGGEIELHPNHEKLFPKSCGERGCPLLHFCSGFEKNYIALRGWRDLRDRVNHFLDTIQDTKVRSKIVANCTIPHEPQTSDINVSQEFNSNKRDHLFVVVKSTYRCNAGCLYCSSHRTSSTPDLSPDMLRKLYAELFEYASLMGISSITFLWHGGEPLLLGKSFYVNAWEESRKQRTFNVEHCMQTNLLLLDREWVQLLKAYGVRLGSSVDPIGKERVYNDGRLQYSDWLEKFNIACEGNLPVGIVFTVTSGHADKALHIYNFFKNIQTLSPRPVVVRVNPVSDVGKATAILDPAQIIKPADFGHFLYRLWGLWNEDGRPFVLSPLHEWYHHKGLSCEFSGNCHKHFLSMDGKGDIYHCGRFADNSSPLGNILGEKLTDILQNPQRQEFHRRAEILRCGQCERCHFWEYCKGGCPYHAFVHSGKILHASPFCEGYKIFFEKSCPSFLATSEER